MENKYVRLESVQKGRSNLGGEMPVEIYRLLEYSIRDVLTEWHGEEHMVEVLREAGRRAGREFAQQALDLSLEFDPFVSALQQKVIELKIGILRIEEIREDGTIMLTISEDLDCSGMPITGKTTCNYDEGFIEGILSTYTGKTYCAREIDCWSKGDRVCRFRVKEDYE